MADDDDTFPPSLLPMARRRRVRLDRRAKLQSAYRARLRERKAPSRGEFASAALTVCLLMYELVPGEAGDAVRLAIIGELYRDGFDRHQAVRRFDDMAERIPSERQAKKQRREREAESRDSGAA